MDAEVQVVSVEAKQSRSGNTRFVLTDDGGKEYTTFRPQIGTAAQAVEGRRARIAFHEEERNGFNNVYLDKVEPLADAPAAAEGDVEPEEAGWNAAIEAAAWLLGSDKPKTPVGPEELFDRLKPFKDRVADDIREGD